MNNRWKKGIYSLTLAGTFVLGPALSGLSVAEAQGRWDWQRRQERREDRRERRQERREERRERRLERRLDRLEERRYLEQMRAYDRQRQLRYRSQNGVRLVGYYDRFGRFHAFGYYDRFGNFYRYY